MTAPFRIGPLGAGQIRACAAIVGETPLFARYGFDARAAATQLEEALQSDTADLLAATARETDLLGFAWLLRGGAFGRSAYLRLIAVASAHRGSGVGSALLDELERRHLASGGILLLATADNVAAHAFYAQRGYRHVGTIEDYVVEGIAERVYFKPPP